jgi:acyl-CoA dehydrogenase
MILDDYRSPWMTLEMEDLRALSRAFLQQEAVPHQERWAEQHMVDRDFWRQAGSTGLLCLSIPEEYGGGGGTFAHEAVLMVEQALSGDDAWANTVHLIVAHYLNACGTGSRSRSGCLVWRRVNLWGRSR